MVKNTTSFFVSLHNAPTSNASSTTSGVIAAPSPIANPGHLSFQPFPVNQKPGKSVSLLVRIDADEYALLPNVSSLVPVCTNTLSADGDHFIRVVAPMIDDGGKGVVELEGLWLSSGGALGKVPGSIIDDTYLDEDLPEAESENIGKKHRDGLNEIDKGENSGHGISLQMTELDLLVANQERRKVVEVITDSPGSITRNKNGETMGMTERLLSGVMGWEYLLGEMFESDHVCVGVDGMCMIQDCHGSNGFPAGIGDVFFRR